MFTGQTTQFQLAPKGTLTFHPIVATSFSNSCTNTQKKSNNTTQNGAKKTNKKRRQMTNCSTFAFSCIKSQKHLSVELMEL